MGHEWMTFYRQHNEIQFAWLYVIEIVAYSCEMVPYFMSHTSQQSIYLESNKSHYIIFMMILCKTQNLSSKRKAHVLQSTKEMIPHECK